MGRFLSPPGIETVLDRAVREEGPGPLSASLRTGTGLRTGLALRLGRESLALTGSPTMCATRTLSRLALRARRSPSGLRIENRESPLRASEALASHDNAGDKAFLFSIESTQGIF